MEELFPAHAGVILTRHLMGEKQVAFPRTRGGDPKYARKASFTFPFSPHTRG